jgi:hypothetical protein
MINFGSWIKVSSRNLNSVSVVDTVVLRGSTFPFLHHRKIRKVKIFMHNSIIKYIKHYIVSFQIKPYNLHLNS